MALISSAADLPKAANALLQAVSAGELSPEEGTAISALLALQSRVLEAAELEQRIAALEQRLVVKI